MPAMAFDHWPSWLRVKAMYMEKGYRFEASDDGNEERMYRSDGSLALVVTNLKKTATTHP